jgi:signal transduction histidine kinase
MTTGLNDIASIKRAFEVGASDFLTKPITLSVLGYHVEYMLKASRTELDLRSAKQQAENANMAKTMFLANMSHELRTPLNAIMGFSELMCTEKLGPIGSITYRDYARDILDSATHLLQVINDILDLTKVESDDLELHKEVFELGETVTDVVRTVGGQAEKAEVSLHARVGSDVPMLYSDERRLKQILLNLVSNSVKFTPQGGKVTTNAAISTTRELSITVSDTGIGIPESKFQIALSPFGQVDEGLARRYEGTGLGLTLAKTMTEQLGGKLSLKSKIGEGTVVTLIFPGEYIFMNDVSLGSPSKYPARRP